jgi:hypothetical protein
MVIETNESTLKEIDKFVETWQKSIVESTKKIRQLIYDFAVANKSLIANGDLAYSIIMTDNAQKSFAETELLTFYLHKSHVSHFFDYDLFAGKRIVFSDLLVDTHSKDIIYYIPGTGYEDPMKITLAKVFIIQDSYVLRNYVHDGVSVVDPEYLFIDWYNSISMPREISSVEKWKSIHEKNNKLQEKYILGLAKNNDVIRDNSSKRIMKLEEYLSNNESIIMVGDFAAGILLGDHKGFRKYKVLVLDNFYEIKHDLAKILRKFNYTYTQSNEFIMHYHGPFVRFANPQGYVILEAFISQEQCIPAFKYGKFQIARFPNIMKYLFLEPETSGRNYLIKSLLAKQKEEYAKGHDEFTDGKFQMYDVKCIGEYTSLLRKKRIKIYKAKIDNKK